MAVAIKTQFSAYQPKPKEDKDAINAWIFFEAMSRIKRLMGDIQIDEAKSLNEFYLIADEINDQLLVEQNELIDKYAQLQEKIAKVEKFQFWANVFMYVSIAAMILAPMSLAGAAALKQGLMSTVLSKLPHVLMIVGGIVAGSLQIVTGSFQIELAKTLKEKAELEEKVNITQAVQETSETTKDYVQGMLRDSFKQKAQLQSAITEMIDSLRNAYKAAFANI